MKRSEVLVASLWGINQGFRSHLGSVHDEAPLFLAVKVSFRVHFRENDRKISYFPFLDSISIDLSSLVYW